MISNKCIKVSCLAFGKRIFTYVGKTRDQGIVRVVVIAKGIFTSVGLMRGQGIVRVVVIVDVVSIFLIFYYGKIIEFNFYRVFHNLISTEYTALSGNVS